MVNDDLALETLFVVQKDIAPDIDRNLLSNCYETQKKHQFDGDRGPSTQAMDRLIEEEVARILATGVSSGGQK